MILPPPCGAVLLIGAPGSGKSVLGKALAATHSLHVHSFINIGQKLRTTDKVERHLQHPSLASKQGLTTSAEALLHQACRDLLLAQAAAAKSCSEACQTSSTPSPPLVLLIEGVKELDHAHTLMDVLEQHSIPLLQVLLINNDPETSCSVLKLLQTVKSTASSYSSKLRDADRLVKERQLKWRQHAASLIEFFSAQGVLVQVAAGSCSDNRSEASEVPQEYFVAESAGAAAEDSSHRGEVQHTRSGSNSSSSRQSTAVPHSSNSGPTSSSIANGWLAIAGWCCPKTRELRCCTYWAGEEATLVATPVEPVVSSRLITSRHQQTKVLRYAAECTGLCISDASSSSGRDISLQSLIAVPSLAVETLADARWLAVPGRYCVSAKVDGTRYLLIAMPAAEDDSTAAGKQQQTEPAVEVYLLNRAGMMYKYPVSVANGVALLPDTVLDGELVWGQKCSSSSSTAQGGMFLVFDALSVGGMKLWHLPLLQRMATATQQLHLPKAATTVASSEPTASSSGVTACGAAVPAASSVSNSSTHQQTTVPGDMCPAGSSSSSGGRTAANSGKPQITAAAAAAAAAAVETSLSITKKQQAPPPGSDTLQLLLKPPYQVTAEALGLLQESQSSSPFPTDGLVFTPSDMPYVLGMSQLMYKWQPPEKTAVDMTAAEIRQHNEQMGIYDLELKDREYVRIVVKFTSQLPNGLVYECLPVLLPWKVYSRPRRSSGRGWQQQQQQQQQSQMKYKVCWVPRSVRWDKHSSNSTEVLSAVQQRLNDSNSLTHQQIVHAVQEVQTAVGTPAASISTIIASSSSAGSTPSTVVAESTAASSSKPSCSGTSGHSIGSSNSSVLQSSNNSTASCHPARCIAFDQLYAAVMEEVSAGDIERWVDEESGLEVFCYRLDRAGPPPGASTSNNSSLSGRDHSSSSGTATVLASSSSGGGAKDAVSSTQAATAAVSNLPAVCRGLVLHPASSTVVATPFVRFGAVKDLSAETLDKLAGLSGSTHKDTSSVPTCSSGSSIIAKTGSHPATKSKAEKDSSKITNNPEDAANLKLYTSWSQSAPATASFKVDGSFIIAFMWDDKLRVTTRRRMNSEQATWASNWLQQHGHLHHFKPGWTYMFEAVYKDNTHVVQYPFEGLVLLEAVTPQGFELHDAAAKRELAEQLGVFAAPTLFGTWNELFSRLAVGCPSGSNHDSTCAAVQKQLQVTAASGARFNGQYEGWVLQDSTTGTRCKLVLERFKQLSRVAGYKLHPLVVWDAVFCGRSAQLLSKGLPPHFKAELMAILQALEQQFQAVQQQVHLELQQRWWKQGHGSGASATQNPADGTTTLGSSYAGVETTHKALAAEQCSSRSRPTVPGESASEKLIVTTDAVCTAAAGCSNLTDGSKDSSNSSVEDNQRQCGINNLAVAAAVQYAASKGSAVAVSMYQPAQPNLRNPALRSRILECIKPDVSGTLTGYTPSPAFRQTYAKGWAKGPQEGRVSVANTKPSILQCLTVPCLASVLTLLREGSSRDLYRALQVCRSFKDVLLADPAVKAKALEKKKEQAKRMKERQASRSGKSGRGYCSQYIDSSYFFDGGCSDHDDYTGYGSPDNNEYY